MKAIHNLALDLGLLLRCCDVVKDRKNESHSQPFSRLTPPNFDVVTLSKIEKMKAIHNPLNTLPACPRDVVTLSKIEIMKATHNGKL